MLNESLPITSSLGTIVQTVNNNQVTIITAETGAGKSTQVVQYLMLSGYKVICTQPRRLAARTVAARVAEEWGCKLGTTVGYRTAHERKESRDTQCLFVTDGLAMARELTGATKGYVLVIDEVHEWNLYIEVLVAWAKLNGVHVVLMSATMETEELSEYFDDAPVITVPGRVYPVEVVAPGASLEIDVVNLLRQGRNVLVFQPGKQEIIDCIELLKQSGVVAEILPLHGELTPEEQQRCLQSYRIPKCVVSTNVAETSLTIVDIDAVVDSGMERREELVNGIKGLYRRPIARSNSKQRMGRAGRTRLGIYIDHCPELWENRPEFPVPEILRSLLDQTALTLADAGIDMEELPFFHQPDPDKIHDAKRSLRLLGCLDQSGSVTKVGRLVSKLPVSVQSARMIVEADRLGVVDDVVTCASILEVGGVVAKVCESCKPHLRNCLCWQRLAPGEQTSDVLAQLAVYHAAEDMDRKTKLSKGIHAKSLAMAQSQRKLLAKALAGKIKFGSSGNRDHILQAITAGMVEHVFVRSFGSFNNGDGYNRRLNNQSVLTDRFGKTSATLVVGMPWDLEVTRDEEPFIHHLIRMATQVTPLMLHDAAPQLVEFREGLNPRYDSLKGMVVSTEEVYFNGQLIRTREVADEQHSEAARLLDEIGLGERRANEAQDRLENLERQAFTVRDRADQLLTMNGDDLTESLIEELADHVVSDWSLPYTVPGLQAWIAAAQAAITNAEEFLANPPAVDVNVLVEHFARR